MKWIMDLPDDFTQDFLFTVEGVDDSHAWLNDKLMCGNRDWDTIVTLNRDEILEDVFIRESILKEDLGEEAIRWTYRDGYVLDGDIEAGCIIVDGAIRVLEFQNNIECLPDLSGLTDLITLYLYNCESSMDVVSVSDLSNLIYLTFGYRAALPEVSVLSGLTSLTHLVFRNSKDLQHVSELSVLSELISLNLSGCEALQDLTGLSGLTKLTHLDLAFCRQLKSISALAGLSNLTFLSLEWSSVRDFSALSSLTNLTWLDLDTCGVKDLTMLSNLTNLIDLKLSDCGVLNVSALSGLTNLEHLDLSFNKSLSDLSGLSRLSTLRSLDLRNCEAIEDMSMLSSLFGLTSLNLNGCHSLKDISWISQLISLTSLDLGDCKYLDDLTALSDLINLTSLNLKNCRALQDITALSGLNRVTSIDLDGCPLVDHSSTHRALRKMYSLKELKGIKEPARTEILWTTASQRGDIDALDEMFLVVLEFCENKHFDIERIRRGLLHALPQMDLSEAQWQQLNQPWWNAEDWSHLWRFMLEADRSMACTLLHEKLRIAKEVGEAMEVLNIGFGTSTRLSTDLHGWLLLLAEGGEWPESKKWLEEFAQWLLLSDLHSAGADLLMALRVLGLPDLESEILSRLTSHQAELWSEQLEYRLARAALKVGNIGQALQSIGRLPENQAGELLSDLIVRWAEEMPEEVAGWMSGFHSESTREQTAFRLASSNSSVATSTARQLVLLDIMSSRDAILPFIESMAIGIPKDAWVQALRLEIGAGGESLSKEMLQTIGLEMLRNDEAVREEVGDRKLRKLIEAGSQDAKMFKEKARQAALELLRDQDLID